MRLGWGLAAIAVLGAHGALAQTPAHAPIPASAFGRLPAVQDAAISPDGARIAILGGAPDRRTVTLAKFDDPKLAVLELGRVETNGVRWAGNDYVLVRTAFWYDFQAHTKLRIERTVTVNAQTQALGALLRSDTDMGFATAQPLLGVVEGSKPQAMVLGLDTAVDLRGNAGTNIPRKGADSPLVWALWRADVASGRGVLVERGEPDTMSWNVDRTGEARVREDREPQTHTYRLFGRAKGQKAWTLLLSGGQDEEQSYLGYADAEDAIYLSQSVEGGVQVMRRRLVDGAVEPLGRPVAGGEVWLQWDRNLDKPIAIHHGGDNGGVDWLDPDIAAVNATLTKAFGGRTVSLNAWSKDRTRFLAVVGSEAIPPIWYLYDKARREISPVGEEYPELKDASLGRVSWITYAARDGLTIPARLILPPAVAGAPPAGKLPLVVLPHGGPSAHDPADFDFWSQYLATRGYAVLQPQFRGSDGYGDAFEKAGYKEWGGKIQTDLLDGVARLAADGVIDPARVCIVGASFGGYSALAGATLHPEAYRCAVSVNGISDLPFLLGDVTQIAGRESTSLRRWRTMMGDVRLEEARLVATSPARQVTARTPPVLLIWGDHDTTVAPAQSEHMLLALQKAGRPVQSLVLKDDDHYLSSSATRTQMLEVLGAFLAVNLPLKP